MVGLKTNAHLEVNEEAVELLLAGAPIEVLSAGVQQGADQTDAEQVLRRVQRARRAIRVHAERDKGEERAEDDSRLHHTVVIQLPQKLSAADPPLVKLGLVHLKTKHTSLHYK